MRSLPWRRQDLIERVRADIWRFLTPAATIEAELLEAAALLQMSPSDLRAIGGLQFLTSPELGELLNQLPFLLRRLATTTTHEEEWSLEQIRGSIQWGRTIGLRHATGIPHLYVTAPSRRAYQTPENELLVFILDETVRLGRLSGWHRSSSEQAGQIVSSRVAQTERWLQSRMLTEVERQPITPKLIARVRSGRLRRRYGAVINAYDRYRSLVGTLDRTAIRRAVEHQGLVTRDDPTLFELVCTFKLFDDLQALGWKLDRLKLYMGALHVSGTRGDDEIDITYQSTPRDLSRGSLYRALQQHHQLSPGGLIPDLVLRVSREQTIIRWLLIEVKGGVKRTVQQAARAAAYDLLAYHHAFRPALENTPQPYGLGIAWGAELSPNTQAEIALCTPDTLAEALFLILDSPLLPSPLREQIELPDPRRASLP
jgi:hypothetical protein